MHLARVPIRLLTAGALAIGTLAAVRAQPAPSGPPAVGVVQAVKRPITETSEFLGRIEAPQRVNVVARDTAFLDKRFFEEGAEVKTGDQLYQLERAPFEADLASKQAQVAQLQATLENAKLTTERARILLSGPAGQQSTYDAAFANQRSLEAQVLAAEAQVKAFQINLDYTDIRSPIDGRIGRTTVTEGNVVGPGSGVLTTIVSQDPMYVIFPVSVREAVVLRERYATRGGFKAVVIKVRLPDGRLYGQTGQLNFVDNTIAQNTDTITLRGAISNPTLPRILGSAPCVARIDRWRIRHCDAGGRAAGRGAGGPALRGACRSTGRLCLHGRSRQQGGAAPDPAWAVDPHSRRRAQRSRAGRQGHRRGPAAGASRTACGAWAGERVDRISHGRRCGRRSHPNR